MTGEPVDDAPALLVRIAAGDRDAFARFYDRFGSLVFTVALRLLRARSEAEDLLQEVFLQAWRQAAAYDPGRGSPEAWLLTITRSRGIDKLRSIRRREERIRPVEEAEGPRDVGVVESGAAQSEAKVTVTPALAALPDAQRRVLELAYFEGLTQSEIATRLGEPLGTVKTRMRTGLERLRGALTEGAERARS
jgi:RNA polymerase sigma-70 factor (ECF subfamily)